jgi:hypothetical protein
MEKEIIFCKSGGASRNESGFLDLYCKTCDRFISEEQDIDDNRRKCLGKCENSCDYVYPYGFVPEDGCKIHDLPSPSQKGEEEIK